MIKIALLMWLLALAIAFFSKAAGRAWMLRLFIGGFCLLLLGLLVSLISRWI
jgi:hypothetical protein